MVKLDQGDMFVFLCKIYQALVLFCLNYLMMYNVKVVKKYLQEGGEIASKMFSVRKKEVLDALKWLKEYNVEYSEIEIQESNLDWIENNNEQELPASLIEMEDNKAMKNVPGSVDMGPSQLQTLSGLQGDSHDGCEIESALD